MKTIFDLCTPREDILQGQVVESDYAADLAQVIRGEAPKEYQNAELFFANTHPTQGLQTLLKNVCQRLSGKGGEAAAVFRLDTQYGGGKTHSLIALTHAARDLKNVANLEEFIEPQLLPQTPVKVAAFDGENADPTNGRSLGNGLKAYTPWGELAYALDGVAGYEKLRQSDLERVAPGADTIRELFGGQPTLILLDELSIYLRKIRGRKEAEQLTPFLTSLFKAVNSSPQACIVFTLAIGKEGKATDAYSQENEFVADKLEEAMKVAGRVATNLNPTSEGETAQVIRRRLFSEIKVAEAEELIKAYQQQWTTHKSDLPTEKLSVEPTEAFRNSFPFHPALMDLLTDKLSTLSSFQRVRGMLRLLTRTVADLWKQQPKDTYAIHIHHLNPGYAPIREEIVTRLELKRFDPAIENDVAAVQSEDSLAQRLDKKWYTGLAPYGSFVARSILWHSLAFNESLQGVDEFNLRYSILSPGLDISFINDARQKFVAESAYLDDRPTSPLRFLTEVNLTVLIRRQKEQVDLEEARAELQDRIRTIFSGNSFELTLFPSGAFEVPDDVGNGRPYLVLIGYDAETIKSDELTLPPLVENIFKTHGSQGNFRQLKNNLLFLVADEKGREEMKEKIHYRLALEAMRTPQRLNQLPEHQQDKVQEYYRRSEQEIAIAIQQCYRHLFYPSRNRMEGAEVNLAHTAIDQPASANNPGVGQQQVYRELLNNQNKLVPSNGEPPTPKYIRDQTPLKRGQMTTTELRGELRKDPRFPILLSDDPFIKMVRQGIEQGIYVYQSGDLLLGQGDPYAEIKIDEQSVIYTTEYAKQHQIWPRPEPSVSGELEDTEAEPSISGGVREKTGDYNSSSQTRTTPSDTGEGEAEQISIPKPTSFAAEAPLREALTQIWEKARSQEVESLRWIKLRVFDMGDAFKLLKAINTAVTGLDKNVTLQAEYETKQGSSLGLKFEGQVAEAQEIQEFLQPQLRAASEASLETTFELIYSNGLALSSDEPEKMTERLARFASSAVYIEASAEATET